MAIIFNVTYLYFVKIVNILLFLHTPLYNIILCPIKFSQFYNRLVKYRDLLKTVPFKVPKFQWGIRNIRIQVDKYLNNMHGIFDSVELID
jgi:hypothetical protein